MCCAGFPGKFAGSAGTAGPIVGRVRSRVKEIAMYRDRDTEASF